MNVRLIIPSYYLILAVPATSFTWLSKTKKSRLDKGTVNIHLPDDVKCATSSIEYGVPLSTLSLSWSCHGFELACTVARLHRKAFNNFSSNFRTGDIFM